MDYPHNHDFPSHDSAPADPSAEPDDDGEAFAEDAERYYAAKAEVARLAARLGIGGGRRDPSVTRFARATSPSQVDGEDQASPYFGPGNRSQGNRSPSSISRRLRPLALAKNSASSARLSTSSSEPSIRATPALAVMARRFDPAVWRTSDSVVITLAQSASAWSAVARGNKIPRVSPPIREMMSSERIMVRSRSEKTISTSSPTAWPYCMLIVLR